MFETKEEAKSYADKTKIHEWFIVELGVDATSQDQIKGRSVNKLKIV